jgi:replicative DNA helicase
MDRRAIEFELVRGERPDLLTKDEKKDAQILKASMPEIIDRLRIEVRKRRKAGKIGEGSGFRFIQKAIGGLVPTFLYVVGAYTSAGKTAFMIQLTINAIINNPKIKSAIFSTEMVSIHILLRMLANLSGTPTLSILQGNLSREQETILTNASKRLKNSNIHIFDNIYTSKGIRQACERIGGLDVVFIDFIQNLQGEGGIYERMSRIAIELQQIAKEHNTCVVAMSQVANQALREDSQIIAYKGAGEIAAAADLGLWLSRDPNNPKDLKVAIRKNRHGTTGKVDLRYINSFTAIEEI